MVKSNRMTKPVVFPSLAKAIFLTLAATSAGVVSVSCKKPPEAVHVESTNDVEPVNPARNMASQPIAKPADVEAQAEPTETGPATSFEHAAKMISQAVKAHKLDLIAPLVPNEGILYFHAPEDKPKKPQRISSKDLVTFSAESEAMLADNWTPLHYLLSAFGEQSELLKADKKKSTIELFACSECTFRIHLHSQDSVWMIEKIVAADYAP